MIILPVGNFWPDFRVAAPEADCGFHLYLQEEKNPLLVRNVA